MPLPYDGGLGCHAGGDQGELTRLTEDAFGGRRFEPPRSHDLYQIVVAAGWFTFSHLRLSEL